MRLRNARVARYAHWYVCATLQNAGFLSKIKRCYNFHIYHFTVLDNACRTILLSQYEKLLFECLKARLVFSISAVFRKFPKLSTVVKHKVSVAFPSNLHAALTRAQKQQSDLIILQKSSCLRFHKQEKATR